MFPFRNILFPTDFSANAHAALKYAAAFARHSGGRVVVVQCAGREVSSAYCSSKSCFPIRCLMAWRRSEFWLKASRRAEIAQGAIDHDIDLITVVMRDRNRFSRAFGSSIAEEIVAESPCAVLGVRPPQRDFVEHATANSDSTETRAAGDKLSSFVCGGNTARDADRESHWARSFMPFT